MSTSALALIIVAAILAQIAVAWRLVRKRKGQQSQKPDAVAAAPRQPATPPIAEARDGAAVTAATGWEGLREFVVQRRVLENGNRDVCSFYLAPTDDKPLPGFRPGQFLTFRLQVEDPLGGEAKGIVRCYTISDRPRAETYRISVKRVSAPPDHPELPPGLSSTHFHDQIKEGNRLHVKAPSGHFHLMEAELLPVVLIGGGIGITPLLSILNALLDAGSRREIWLFYGVRNGREQIMKTHLEVLADTHSRFHLHLCYSAPDDGDIEGVDFQHRQRVDIPLLRSVLRPMRHQFYVCGPRPLMEGLIPGLEAWGVDGNDIYYESFGPSTLTKTRKSTPKLAAERPVTVHFRRSGKTFTWNPAVASLLELAESNAIDVDSGCRAGSCGSCQTALEAGEVEYSQRPDADIEAGHCLLCISTPKTDLTLAA